MNRKSNTQDIYLKVRECLRAGGIRSMLVAVSGGADSVALLRACLHVAQEEGIKVEAANCNFHLRGEESDRDSEFTAVLCSRLGVRLHRLDYDVKAYMDTHPGLSIEMACRTLRYSDFFRICRERGLDRVAVAHNADDDIETLMLSLLRGSGSRGLRGMDSDNGRVIRPLLDINRTKIESFLKELGQDFITDSSNLSSDFRRNFIRLDVLPLLESRWPGARKSLSRTLSIMKEEAGIVDNHYNNQLKALCPDPTTLLVYEKGVTTGTIQRFIEPFGGKRPIAEEISEALRKPFGLRRWKIDPHHTLILERDRLSIKDCRKINDSIGLNWSEIGMSDEAMAEVRQNRNRDIVYLPNGEGAYTLRRPETGDKIAPLGMKGTRMVSDVISDAKLDTEEKSRIRVLVRISDGEIIWITGLKRSRHDLIEETATIIHKAEYRIKPIEIH